MNSNLFLRSLAVVFAAAAPLTGYADHDHGHFSPHVHFYGGYYGGYGGPYYYGPSYWGPSFGFSYYSSPSYAYRGYVDDYRGDSLAAEVQDALRRRGYYHGVIDGELGPMSRDAIRAFQANRGLPVTGRIDRPLVHALGLG